MKEYGGPLPPRWLTEHAGLIGGSFVAGVGILVAVLCAITAGLIVLVVQAWAGCAIIPDVEVVARRQAICTLLELGEGCFFVPRRLVAATIRGTETEWTLTVAGRPVGTWPMGPVVEPVDPTRCGDVEWLRSRLRFHTGTELLQATLRRQFPEIRPRDVVYVDDLLEPGRREADACVLTAQLLVVSR